ncbi:MAG TPA: HAD family hydrolase [Clostridia bacterium]|nr:HAD family hydrolase [Clostridia bacterium]
MIRMLAVDLDETLLRSDKTISAYTQEVLNKACAEGIRIVFATARPYRVVGQYLKQVQCAAVICHNGAVTFADGQKTGKCYGIPIVEAAGILRILQERHPEKRLSVEINDRIYANFDVTAVWGKTKEDIEVLKASTVRTDFHDLPDMDADKVLVEICSDKEHEEVKSLLPPDLYTLLSDNGKLCVIMNKKATKFNAIRCMAEQWGIPVSDIAAFGDDYNDIEMIRQCGIGVAMGNAVDEALAAADAVTDTNNNDGVAGFIVKEILAPDRRGRDL